jgi:ATP-dependent Clp protease ATP-binding subunit ClpA
LKRLLQTAIADPLALAILDGTFRDGDSVRVSVDGERLGFEKA